MVGIVSNNRRARLCPDFFALTFARAAKEKISKLIPAWNPDLTLTILNYLPVYEVLRI